MIKCRELVVCELLQVCNVTVKASGEHRGTVVQVEYLPSSSTVCTPLLQVLRCCNQCKALPCKMQTTVAFIIHSTDYDVWLPGVACCNSTATGSAASDLQLRTRLGVCDHAARSSSSCGGGQTGGCQCAACRFWPATEVQPSAPGCPVYRDGHSTAGCTLAKLAAVSLQLASQKVCFSNFEAAVNQVYKFSGMELVSCCTISLNQSSSTAPSCQVHAMRLRM
jgi:hypothetical protein